MVKKTAFVLCFLLSLSTAKAQLFSCGTDVPKDRNAFQEGEMLSYNVSYSAAIINAEVADITFNTSSASYMGRDCYKIEAVGQTRPFYSMFFTLKDIYTTWIDKTTLRPIKATSSISEGSYKYRTAMDFNWTALRVRTEGQNLKNRDLKQHTLTLSKCSYDAIALFYNLRSADLSQLRKGESQSLNLVLEDTIRTIRFRFLDHDKRKISDLGEFNTLKFACQFATSNDVSFKDGAEFFIWLSDDKNRIPIHLESPIRVGKVSATLSNWSGLKHPFSSLVIRKSK